MAEALRPTGASGPSVVPRPVQAEAPVAWWLDLAVTIVAVVVFSVGTTALVLAMGGWFSTQLAVALGLAAALPLAWRLRSVFPRVPLDRGRTVGAVLAVLLALVAGGWGSYAASHHVLIDRDPGSYVSTGKWIQSTGDLEATDAAGPFASEPGASLSSSAVTETSPGRLQFQFNHFVGAFLAVADGVGGTAGIFRAVALLGALGLLAIYSVTARATRRPIIALIAPAMVALSIPFLSVTRDVYSEPAALLFLWTALVVFDQAYRKPRPFTAAVGGLLLGATVVARVDSAVYLSVLAAFLVAFVHVDRARGGDARRRTVVVGACIGAVVPVAVLGVIDIMWFSQMYYRSVRPMLIPLWLLTAAVVVLGVAFLALVPRGERVRRFVVERRRTLALVASSSVAVVLVAGWLARPALTVERKSTQTWVLLAGIQSREGQQVDLYRTYAEDTLRWMGWYLGAIGLVLAIVGLARLVHRIVDGRAVPAEFMVAVLLVVMGAMYFWNPRITPDHIWSMRRFVPAILPALAVSAAVAVGWGSDRAGSDPWRRAGVLAVGVLAVGGVGATSLQVPLFREQHGYARVVEEACDVIGPDRAVLVVGTPSIHVLPQTLRSWCGVHVASAPDEVANDPDALSAMASRLAEAGTPLVVVSAQSEALTTAASIPGAERRSTSTALATNRLEHTLDEMPDEYMLNHETFHLPAEFRVDVVELSGDEG